VTQRAELTSWTREGLKAYGFQGFVTFAALPMADVPHESGVYWVIRPPAGPPRFLEESPARHLCGAGHGGQRKVTTMSGAAR
jgi:hypothetical protein